MKDSELFKKLKFSGGDYQEQNETSWSQKLDRIEDYLINLKEGVAQFFETPDPDPTTLRFKLELNSREHNLDLPDQLQSTECILRIFQQSNDFQPIYRQTLFQNEGRFTPSDLEWISAFRPYMCIVHDELDEELDDEPLKIVIPPSLQREILQDLCIRKILFHSLYPEPQVLTWNESLAKPTFYLQIRKDIAVPEGWKVWGNFKTPGETEIIDLWDIQEITSGGIVRKNTTLFHCLDPSAESSSWSLYPWAHLLLQGGAIFISLHSLGDFLDCALRLIPLDAFDLPHEIEIEIVPSPTQPLFYVTTQLKKRSQKTQIEGFIWFRLDSKTEYPSQIHKNIQNKIRPKILNVIQHFNPVEETFHISVWVPDLNREKQALDQVRNCKELLFDSIRKTFQFKISAATEILYFLLNQGWEVWAENLRIRILKDFQIQLTTDQNWFDVNICAGNPKYPIQAWQLIHMLKKQRMFIQLGDGSLGLLPEHWYREFQRLFSLRYKTVGTDDEDTLRFSKAHAFHLTEMAQNQDFQSDPAFEQIRREILNLNGLMPMSPSPSFRYTLRPYQEHGLSWMHFLGRTKLGGCLADDMGLGKTTQLLAYLDLKRSENAKSKKVKTLLVCPKSLLEHWVQEAKKCAPMLRCLILRNAELSALSKHWEHHDIFLVSYGLVRIHSGELQNYCFDLLVLDEAQMIKNSETQVSLSIKQLRGEQRLALTGTPIENHLGELFSLFEFLNPGLSFPRLIKNEFKEDLQPDLTQFLAGIRPMILRRLKSEVADELPPKSEQTVVLPMNEKQDSIYVSLKNYYHAHLKAMEMSEDSQDLLDKSFFLEGLLRLRQASCHPDLLSSQLKQKHTDGLSLPDLNSNKFDFLLSKLKALAAAGHKAVVFSQFTSLLKLFIPNLDSDEIPYEYLDGQSENRIEIIQRFQENSEIPVLLTGIKSGGLGLNLTAADYCFILDPWWNPAVEQQAIDRIYRIGQDKPVSIYRIVSKNTVEEKMLALQEEKQKIANQLVTADHVFLQRLTFEDFRFLFT